MKFFEHKFINIFNDFCNLSIEFEKFLSWLWKEAFNIFLINSYKIMEKLWVSLEKWVRRNNFFCYPIIPFNHWLRIFIAKDSTEGLMLDNLSSCFSSYSFIIQIYIHHLNHKISARVHGACSCSSSVPLKRLHSYNHIKTKYTDNLTQVHNTKER